MRRQASSWRHKFANAFRGIAVGVRGQNSFHVHVPVAIAIVVAGVILRLEPIELGVLSICIGVVLAAELFNSSIEALAKAVTDQDDDDVRDALDIASGAVLVMSIVAAIVGAITFASNLL